MKIGIYTGSFNPFHEGHQNVLERALKLFDKVIIAVGVNHSKKETMIKDNYINELDMDKVSVLYFSGLLVDYIKKLKNEGIKCDAVIRGLRNEEDLKYEKDMMYHNEDLGLKIPVVCFIADRNFVHVSGTAIRTIDKIKRGMK